MTNNEQDKNSISAEKADTSLAAHDRQFHGGSFDPATQECQMRQGMAAAEQSDYKNECTPVMAKPTDEQQKKMEAYIREKAAKHGFDPDIYLAHYRRRQEKGCKIMLSQWMKEFMDEVHRRGWAKGIGLDYEAGVRPLYGDDREVDCWDCWFEFVPNFGGSEGIYVDWNLRYYDEKSGNVMREYLSAFKTLDEDLPAMERMGLLAGRLTWLGRNLYP